MINMSNTSIKHNGPNFNNCSSTRNVKYLVLKYSVLLVLFYNSCLDVYLFGIQFSLIQIQYVFFPPDWKRYLHLQHNFKQHVHI